MLSFATHILCEHFQELMHINASFSNIDVHTVYYLNILANTLEGHPCPASKPIIDQHTVDYVLKFQELMYKDASRWSLAFQSYVQLTMAEVHRKETVSVTSLYLL